MPRKVIKDTVRAMSAYQAFATGMRRELCAEVPFGESSKVLAAAWKEVSPEARAEWQSKADEATRQRRERRSEQEATSSTAGPSGAVVKKKRKPTAFLMFSKSYRSTYAAQNPKCEFGAASRACGAAWKALDESDKAKWQAKANEPSEGEEDGEEERRLEAVVEVAEEEDQDKADGADTE
jgi:hypothetical protein